jgi:hypothetical protein
MSSKFFFKGNDGFTRRESLRDAKSAEFAASISVLSRRTVWLSLPADRASTRSIIFWNRAKDASRIAGNDFVRL